jgi:hypothetical protein
LSEFFLNIVYFDYVGRARKRGQRKVMKRLAAGWRQQDMQGRCGVHGMRSLHSVYAGVCGADLRR